MRARLLLSLLGGVLSACGGPERAGVSSSSLTGPTPNSSLPSPGVGAALGGTISWSCFVGAPPGIFSPADAGCPQRPDVIKQTVRAASVPGVPDGLAATVDGSTVTLSWRANCCSAPSSYQFQVGSAPGLSNLAVFATGNAATRLVVEDVPAGTYYVRVGAINGEGASAFSLDTVVRVGGATCIAPGPSILTFSTTSTADGTTAVSLAWTAPAVGTPPFAYVLRAGSTAGANNLFDGPVGTGTSLIASVPNGQYYVRVLATNNCGGVANSGPESNEVSFNVVARNPFTFVGPPPGVPLAGVVNVPFVYSFCRPPLPNLNSAVCDATATDPTGGEPPYHFQLDSGVGLPPPGFSLALNGILSGTPLAPTPLGGTRFGVVAVDAAGNTPSSQRGSLSSLRLPMPSVGPAAASVGRTVTIVITEACTFTVTPRTNTIGYLGGEITLTVATSPACDWIETDTNDVFSVDIHASNGVVTSWGATATGSGTITLFVLPSSGAARTLTITVAGQAVTINQQARPACSFTVSPQTVNNIAAIGGSATVSITTASTCDWTAANSSGVTVTGVTAVTNGRTTSTGASGTGSGSVTFSVNGSCRACGGTGAARTLTVTVAGQVVTINQLADTAPTCTGAPNAPIGLTAVVSGSTIQLSWSAPSGGQQTSSYTVEIGSSSGASNIVTATTTSTSYTTSALSNGTYYGRVRAVNSCGTSTASNEASVTIGGTLTGRWTGTWSWTGPGLNGCTYNDGGAFSMTVTQTGNSVSGTLNAGGIQARRDDTCAVTSTDDSDPGTISGTLSGTTFSYSFSVNGGNNSLSFSGTAALSVNTLTGTVTRSTGGSGSLRLTKQ